MINQTLVLDWCSANKPKLNCDKVLKISPLVLKLIVITLKVLKFSVAT